MLATSVHKTVSWFVVSFVVIGVPTWAVTTEFGTSVLSTLLACVFKSPVYFVHEKVWHKRTARDAQQFESGLGI